MKGQIPKPEKRELDAFPLAERLVAAALESDDSFRASLESALDILGVGINDLASAAKMPQSTLYKLVSGEREPNIRTLRQLVSAIKRLEGGAEEGFVAVIVAREVLNGILDRKLRTRGKAVRVREYPARTVEDAIVAAVRAEREGALGVVCAPIIAPTIERILRIPITTIMPKKCVAEAIKIAARKAV